MPEVNTGDVVAFVGYVAVVFRRVRGKELSKTGLLSFDSFLAKTFVRTQHSTLTIVRSTYGDGVVGRASLIGARGLSWLFMTSGQTGATTPN